MKCPRCWTEKAFRHRRQDWKARLLAAVTLVPMKCHHCYHKFHVLWLLTLGQQIDPHPGGSTGRAAPRSELLEPRRTTAWRADCRSDQAKRVA